MKRSLLFFTGIVLILTLVLSFSVSGCSSGTTTTTPAPTTTTPAPTTTTPAPTTTTPAPTTTTPAPTTTEPASTTPPAAGNVISWEDAASHIGETITVEGPIIDKFDIGTAMLLGMGKSGTDPGTVGIEISYSLASELPSDLYVGQTIRVTGLSYQNPLGGCSVIAASASDIEVVD